MTALTILSNVVLVYGAAVLVLSIANFVRAYRGRHRT